MATANQGRRRLLGDLLLGACVMLPLGAITFVVQTVNRGRGEVLAAIRGFDPSQPAPLLGGCIGRCVTKAATFWGGIAIAVLALLGALGALLYLRRRLAAGPRRSLATTSVVCTALAVMLFGAGMTLHTQALYHSLSAAASAAPGERVAIVYAAITAAAPLARAFIVAAIGTLVIGLVLVLLRSRRAPDVAPSGRLFVLSLLLLLAGGSTFVATRGHAADAARSLPPAGGVRHLVPGAGIKPPRLPLGKPLGHSIVLTASHDDVVTLEGSEVAVVRDLVGDDTPPWAPVPKLVTQLRQHAHNWKVTHPKTPFPGELALFADLRTPNRALAHLLASAKTTGYRRVHLMTFRPELTHSAVLGEIRAQRDLAVAVDLVDGAARGTTLDLAASYQSLARAADQANGAGRRLRLRVP